MCNLNRCENIPKKTKTQVHLNKHSKNSDTYYPKQRYPNGTRLRKITTTIPEADYWWIRKHHFLYSYLIRVPVYQS